MAILICLYSCNHELVQPYQKRKYHNMRSFSLGTILYIILLACYQFEDIQKFKTKINLIYSSFARLTAKYSAYVFPFFLETIQLKLLSRNGSYMNNITNRLSSIFYGYPINNLPFFFSPQIVKNTRELCPLFQKYPCTLR